jgi:hypothetical protein
VQSETPRTHQSVLPVRKLKRMRARTRVALKKTNNQTQGYIAYICGCLGNASIVARQSGRGTGVRLVPCHQIRVY